MKRKYEMKKRAESQAETHRRIVEAAIELHSTTGPARTSVSDIARLAGVQRHTFYRHFPTERSLALACSGLYAERNPAPDPEPWLELEGADRLRRGLTDLYDFYEHNQKMFSRVLADAEVHPLTRELTDMRFGEALSQIRAVLANALPRRKGARATLDLALEFRTWQRLQQSGLKNGRAADAMVRALLAQ